MDKNISYEEMSPGKVWEQSEVPTDKVPYQNPYELERNSDFNQSGTKGK